MPTRRRSSLQAQLPLAAALLLLGLASVMTLVSYYQVRGQARELAASRLDRVAERLAASVGLTAPKAIRQIEAVAGLRAAIAAAVGRAPFDSAILRQRLDSLRGGDAANTVVSIWDTDGVLVLGTPLPDSMAPWFGSPDRIDSVGFTPLRLLADSLVYYDLVAPIHSAGAVVGYVQRRSRVVGSAATSSTVGAMLGDSGRLLFGSAGGVWTDLQHRIAPPGRELLGSDEPMVYVRDGRERLGSARPVPGTPWIVVAELPLASVVGPSEAFIKRLSAIALLLVALATLAAWMLGRGITRPLRSLAEAAGAIRAGHLDRRATARGHPELTAVARVFNEMMTETGRHIEAMRVNDERLRSLISASAQIVWFTAADGMVRGGAPSWEEFTGQSAAMVQGLGWLDAVHPEDRERVREAWLSAVGRCAPFDAEYRVRRADGEDRILHSRGVPVLGAEGQVREWVRVSTDITPTRRVEQRLARQEEELAQSRRLDAIGRLAGGVAHDFNNMLTAILVPAELALESLPPDSPVRSDLEEIRDAGDRATELTRQLLAFSRQQVFQVDVVDFDLIVQEASRIIRRLIPESIAVDVRLGSEGQRVKVDRSQVEQVIINLAVNARDAMPTGGELLIETAMREVSAEDADRHDGLEPGPYVMLSVTDSGVGMDAETRERIFEPFFTTKARGHGTGLGLATVYGIVRQSGGDIWLYSEPGEGTVVKVHFPVAVDEARATVVAPVSVVPHGEETLLFAEDDAAIRRIGQRMLRRLGYEVLVASDGAEALVLARAHDGPIHLLMSDVVMPGMSGVELYEQLQEERPGIPVLFLSGWTGEAVTRHRLLQGDVPFLQKPFTSAKLGQKVYEVLHGGGGSD